MNRSRPAVLVIVVLGVLCTLGGLVLLALSWSAPVPDSWGFRGFTVIFATAFGGVGAILAYRRPANRVGWVMLASGTLSAIQVLVEEYAIYGVVGRAVPLPGAILAGWVESWIWLVGVILIVVYSLLLFPSGTLVSSRWRIVAWLAALNLGVGVGTLAFGRGPLNNAPFADNPFPLLDRDLSLNLFLASFVGVALLTIASAASLIVRYRRSAGAERQQLKWLAFAALVLMIATGATSVVQILGLNFKPAQVLFIAAIAVLPVAIGVAVLRYRLYDIDILINRALVYGATTASIAAAFFVGIVVLQGTLRPITGGSEIAVAISTLACFGLFQPVRRRMQRGVDRRFYRARYDASRTLDEFTGHLAGEVDLGAVRASLLDAVGDTLQPSSASVWLRNDSRTPLG